MHACAPQCLQQHTPPPALLALTRCLLHPPLSNPLDFLADQKGLPRDKVLTWTPYPGGAPCNVATCLSRLGVATLFVSALGKDERGEQLMALMKGEGVMHSWVEAL